jgi:glycopeptide antibiotics resistance protein
MKKGRFATILNKSEGRCIFYFLFLIYLMLFLPGCLFNSRYFASTCEFPKTNSAEPEISHITPFAPAAKTAPHNSSGKFRRFFGSSYL